jgi:hypothetical protein
VRPSIARCAHAQHLDPADIPRRGTLGVIAAMQGIHYTSDGPGRARLAEIDEVWRGGGESDGWTRRPTIALRERERVERVACGSDRLGYRKMVIPGAPVKRAIYYRRSCVHGTGRLEGP